MDTLSVATSRWVDTEENALMFRDEFTAKVDADEQLLEHREYIEKRAYGMGERCFHWLWNLLVDEMPDEFRFLEIGVYKGQVLSLIRLLADRTMREAEIVGVTPLSKFAGVTGKFPDYPDEDYMGYITALHEEFGLQQPCLVIGDSTDPANVEAAKAMGPYDMVYIDGCHEYDYVVKDLMNYGLMVKQGGYLIMDDASNNMKQPWGFFQGIEDVSRAARSVIEVDPHWEHLLALVHNRVWRAQ